MCKSLENTVRSFLKIFYEKENKIKLNELIFNCWKPLSYMLWLCRFSILWASNSRSWGYIWPFGLLLELFPSYWVVLSSLIRRRGVTCSYCNLVCHFWLIYMGSLPFSEGQWRKRKWIQVGKRKWEKGLGGKEGRETVVGI